MIRIKHKQTKQVKTIPVYEWDQDRYNHETWTVISESNLVQLYAWHPNEKFWIKRHRMEKKDAIKLVKENHNTLKYEALPGTGSIKDRIIARNEDQSHTENLPEELRNKQPIIQETTQFIKTNHSGIGSFKKWLKTISIKNIIEMIIAGVIVGLLIYLWHLNAIRK